MSFDIQEYKANLIKEYQRQKKIEVEETKKNQNPNFLVKAVSTVSDFGNQISKGVLGRLEGIVDAGATIIGQVGGLFDSGFKEDVKNFVSTDYTEKIADTQLFHMVSGNYLPSVINLFEGGSYEDTVRNVEQYSYLDDGKVGEFVKEVGSGIGGMLPSIATAPIGLGMATFGAGVFGESTEEAIQGGADFNEAALYGVANTVLEVAVERLSAGVANKLIGVNSGLFNTSNIQNTVTKIAKGNRVVELGLQMLGEGIGEGAEEAISEALNPYLKRLTYDENADLATLNDVLESALVGMATSVVLTAGHNMGNKNTPNTRIANNILEDVKTVTTELRTNPNLSEMEKLNLEQKRDGFLSEMQNHLNKMKDEEKQAFVNTVGDRNVLLKDFDFENNKLNQKSVEDFKHIGKTEIIGYENYTEAQKKVADEATSTITRLNNSNNFRDVDVEVRVFDNIDNIIENGYYDKLNNKIVINANSKDYGAVVATHEYIHSLEGTRTYNNLVNYIVGFTKSAGLYDKLKTEIETLYKGKAELNDNLINEEITSRMGEMFLSDKKVINKITREKIKLSERIKEQITNLLKSFKKEERIVRKFLKNAERLYVEAIENRGIEVEFDPDSSDVKYSIKEINGEKAVSVQTNLDLFKDAVTKKDYLKIAKQISKKIFVDGKTTLNFRDGKFVFSKKSYSEMLYSSYTRKLKKKISELYKNKILLINEFLDTMEGFSKHEYTEDNPTYKERKDGLDTFSKAEIKFEINGEFFSGEVVVASKSNGKSTPNNPKEYLFYDIVGIKKEPTPQGDIPHIESGKDSQGVDSDKIILKNKENVNGETENNEKENIKHSIKDNSKTENDSKIETVDDVVREVQKSVGKEKAKVSYAKVKTQTLSTLIDKLEKNFDNPDKRAKYAHQVATHFTFNLIFEGKTLQDVLSPKELNSVTKQLEKAILANKKNKNYLGTVVNAFSSILRKQTEYINYLKNGVKFENSIIKRIGRLKEFAEKEFRQGTVFAELKPIAKAFSTNLVYKGSLRKNKSKIFEEVIKMETLYKTVDSPFYNEFEVEVKEMITQLQMDYAKAKLLEEKRQKVEITTTQLEIIDKVYAYLEHLIKNYDQAMLENEKISVRQTAKEEIQRLKNTKEIKNKFISKIRRDITDFTSYIGEVTGDNPNSVITKFVEEIKKAEQKSKVQKLKFLEPFKKLNEESDLRKELKKTISFNGEEITKGEALSLIMIYKREIGKNHILGEGIELNDSKTKNKKLISNITEEDITNLENDLKGLEDLQEAVYNFFNKETQEVYKEASLRMKGFHYEVEKNYFPINCSKTAMNSDLGDISQMVKFINSNYNPNFTKKATKRASMRIEINDCLDIVEKYAESLSTYANLAPVIKDFNKIYNKKVTKEKVSVKLQMSTLDSQFDSRFNEMAQAVQGQKFNAETSIFGTMRKAGAVAILAANIKSGVMQLSSLPFSFSYINSPIKNKAVAIKKGIKNLKANHEFLMKNSDYYRVRYEEGGLSAAEGLLDKTSKLGEKLMKHIEFVDILTHSIFFEASGRNISEFERASRLTQPSSFITENGKMTRDGEFKKQFLMFNSDGRKMLARMYDVVRKYHNLKELSKVEPTKTNIINFNEAKAQLKATSVGILETTVLAALITTLFKYLLDRDEKEKGFFANLASDFLYEGVLGNIPFIRDGVSLIKDGYEPQDLGISVTTNLLKNAADLIKTITDDSKTKNEMSSAVLQFTTSLSQVFGIPANNIRNYSTAVINMFNPEVAYKMNSIYYGTTNSRMTQDLNENLKSNSKSKAILSSILLSRVGSNNHTPEALETILQLYKEDYRNILPKTTPSKISLENKNGEVVEVSLTTKEQTAFKKIYSGFTEALNRLTLDSKFKNYTSEKKAKAIRKLNEIYYELAKKNFIDSLDDDSLVSEEYSLYSLARSLAPEKLVIYLEEVGKIRKQYSPNSKGYVESYLSKQQISIKNKKALLEYLGYSV